MGEEREVPGFPGIKALPDGSVRGVSGVILRGRPDRDGYLYVSVRRDGSPRKQDRTAVHRLVCLAFHGSPPSSSHQVAHGNGVPDDNRPSNLRWATMSENHRDKLAHGTDLSGERNGRAKLSWASLAQARRDIAGGMERQEVALRLGVHRSTLRRALNGESWGNP